MELFKGAMGVSRTRVLTVPSADPTEAAEIVLLADLLMWKLDRRE
jgi:hypothetical protein